MTPPQSLQSHQNEALQAQIVALGERMDQGFSRLENILSTFENRVRGLENREAGCQPLITSRLDAAWREIDSHTAEIKKLNEVITELRQANRIITWLGGTVGGAIILWIVGQTLGLIR